MDWRAIPTLLRLSMTRHTDAVVNAVSAAWTLAATKNHESITPAHLLVGLLAAKDSGSFLERLGFEPRDRIDADDLVGHPRAEHRSGRLALDPEVRSLLLDARRIARGSLRNFIGREHLILAFLERSEAPSSALLRRLGADPDKIRARIHGSAADFRVLARDRGDQTGSSATPSV